jgi:hypothetical protein
MRIEIEAIIAALESRVRNSDPLLWVGGAPTGTAGGVQCRQPASRLPVYLQKLCAADIRLAPNAIADVSRMKGIKLANL